MASTRVERAVVLTIGVMLMTLLSPPAHAGKGAGRALYSKAFAESKCESRAPYAGVTCVHDETADIVSGAVTAQMSAVTADDGQALGAAYGWSRGGFSQWAKVRGGAAKVRVTFHVNSITVSADGGNKAQGRIDVWDAYTNTWTTRVLAESNWIVESVENADYAIEYTLTDVPRGQLIGVFVYPSITFWVGVPCLTDPCASPTPSPGSASGALDMVVTSISIT